jgi:carboxyl-terminal processing protease
LDKRKLRLGMTVWATVVGTLIVLPSARAAELPSKLDDLLKEAKQLEDGREWAKAWQKYHEIRRFERNPPKEVQEGYQLCLRRLQQYRRLRDNKPTEALAADLSLTDAKKLYAQVLAVLNKRYVDNKKVGLGDLFQAGVQEMSVALEDEVFVKDNVRADAKPESLRALKSLLDDLRDKKPDIKTPEEARELLRDVLMSSSALGIKPTPVLIEFICGACGALDEYTGYLPPRQFAEIEAELSGKYVGIGVELGVAGGKLVVVKVHNGPSTGRLEAADIILSIDGEKPDPANPAALTPKLQGKAGTPVDVEVERPSVMSPGMRVKKYTLTRDAVSMRSVESWPSLTDDGVGYVKITSFQKTTAQDLRSALLALRAQGLKALILDLRGNPGGSFDAAVEVAEMFLSEGVIVYTETPRKEEVKRASNRDALTLPVVVLVDGDTASAAEIVAGALKDNNRALLVGQPTFGKGTVQCVLKLDSIKSGLQVTVKRFVSPDRVPYDGRGITPHHVVENSTMMPMSMGMPQDDDLQRRKAFEFAAEMVSMAAKMPTPKMPPPR